MILLSQTLSGFFSPHLKAFCHSQGKGQILTVALQDLNSGISLPLPSFMLPSPPGREPHWPPGREPHWPPGKEPHWPPGRALSMRGLVREGELRPLHCALCLRYFFSRYPHNSRPVRHQFFNQICLLTKISPTPYLKL